MASLFYRERPARGRAEGLVILHHGRGADEGDLLGLAELLDPERLHHVVCPAAPLTLHGSPGKHWYVVPRVGYPDPETFASAYDSLAALHDELWETTGIGPSRTVLGGFSMGTVMSYATGLGSGRPPVAGILALSGFIPTVEGWSPEPAEHENTRVFIAHGRNDPVIGVEFARRAKDLLIAGGLDVDYHESGAAHYVDPTQTPMAMRWLQDTLAR